MQTKRYTVNFTGLDQEMYTGDSLSRTWERAADEVYMDTGIYVSARMDLSYFICGQIRNCQLGGLSASFMSVWNPAETGTEDRFYDAFIQVVKKVRKRLGNPHMGITIEDVDFYYFVKVE